MECFTQVNNSDRLNSAGARDTVHIMRDAFEPDQLSDVIEVLEEDGHRHTAFGGFDGIQTALADPSIKLLLLGVVDGELSHLVEALKSSPRGVYDVPVLVYFKGNLAASLEDLLAPEIDDFLLEPLNLRDISLRVNRLTQPLAVNLDDGNQVRLNLLSHFGLKQFIGSAPSFLAVVKKIPRVAACDATALLIGDTGTGKEMCARAIHYLGPRAKKPFIAINCGSIPADLFENELFGHDAGAFTDARSARSGLIAEAEGGTLFLDEVSSLSLASQVKLLRFLQDQQYRPLGASHYRQANVRVIAASNQDLQGEVRKGTFREDLYYRLNVILLRVPTLRDRQEDIISLANHFFKTSAYEYSRSVKTVSQSALQKLVSYGWPGNVRELENVVRQSVILSEGRVIRAEDLQLSSDLAPAAPATPLIESFKDAKARTLGAFERNYLERTLELCGGNISKAARTSRKDGVCASRC